MTKKRIKQFVHQLARLQRLVKRGIWKNDIDELETIWDTYSRILEKAPHAVGINFGTPEFWDALMTGEQTGGGVAMEETEIESNDAVPMEEVEEVPETAATEAPSPQMKKPPTEEGEATPVAEG